MAGRLDFAAIIQNAFHLFKGKLHHVCSGPVDGMVLKMHYRWTFFFTLGGFLTVWYGWYNNKDIHCVTSFNGDVTARVDYQAICLSYPFITDKNGEKRFLLFYRWVHWTLLFVSFLFYVPRKVSKSIENPKAKKILEDLATLSPRYDQSEKDVTTRATLYMIGNIRTHNSIYFKYLGVHILALIIDVFILRFIDFILHDRFISLIPKSYPFYRDPLNFEDYISQTFPPFVSCNLNENHKIIPGRTEEIGCHLYHMEMYEKLFFIFWFIIYTLIVVTLLHIIFLAFMSVPFVRKWYMLTSKPLQANKPASEVIVKVLQNLKVGDIYMLYRLKQHLSPARFYELLMYLANPKIKPNAPEKETLKPDSRPYQQSIWINDDPKQRSQQDNTSYNPKMQDHHRYNESNLLQRSQQDNTSYNPKMQDHHIYNESNMLQRSQDNTSYNPKMQDHHRYNESNLLQRSQQDNTSYNPKMQDHHRYNASNMLNTLLRNPNNAELIKRFPELLRAKNIQDKSILIE